MRYINRKDEPPIVMKAISGDREKTPDRGKKLPCSGQNGHDMVKKRGYYSWIGDLRASYPLFLRALTLPVV